MSDDGECECGHPECERAYQEDLNIVRERLRLREAYRETGEAIWTAPDGTLTITTECPDPDDPNTWEIPTWNNNKNTVGTRTVIVPKIEKSYYWGTLHAVVEGLFRDGWTLI